MRKALLWIFVALGFISCSDFLDREPLDQIITESFYQDKDQAELGVLSMYSVIQHLNWTGKAWMMLEIPSDNSTTGGNDPDFSPIDNFTISANNTPNAEFWAEHYRLVTMSNQILTYVPDVTMDEEIKASFLGEAKFLRAFSYFDLVRIYGAVPIVTELPDINADLNIPRSSIEDVYSFIVADLLEAIESLPEVRDPSAYGRATSTAAKALLAKVYVTTGEYDKCITLCREIIASNKFSLVEKVEDNWLRDVSDNNAESIFQVQYIGCGPQNTGNANQAFFAPWGQGITQNNDGWGSQVPTSPSVDNPGTTIKDAFSEEDLRKYHTIMSPADFYPMINAADGGYTYPAAGASRSGISIKKYVIGGGPDVCFMSTPQNFHIIRYADVLLLLAEASCARNGGVSVTPDVIAAYNAVRSRAGLETVSSINIDDVFNERRLEFAFENQRWFDLLRSGNALEILQLHGKSLQFDNLLFPIPAEELARNNALTQNIGY